MKGFSLPRFAAPSSRTRLLVIAVLLLVGVSVGGALGFSFANARAGAVENCAAPMDAASPSLAGGAPVWVTFDRAAVGPEMTAKASSDAQSMLVVANLGTRDVSLSIREIPARRAVELLRPDGTTATEVSLHEDSSLYRGPLVWEAKVGARFVNRGCYEAELVGLFGKRTARIRID